MTDQTTDPITQFQGEYRFLSNFWQTPTPIQFGDWKFATAEHAYQAAKCKYPHDWLKVQVCGTPASAKRLGRTLPMRGDWEEIKIGAMAAILYQKFLDQSLYEKLMATGDRQLIEGNTWGDTFWGVDLKTGEGENHLGRLLMDLRSFLRSDSTPDTPDTPVEPQEASS